MNSRKAAAVAMSVIAIACRICGIFMSAMTVLLCFSGLTAKLQIVGFVVELSRALPSAIGMGAGAEARRPLGLAVVGGLCFSQLVTLYITPVYYAYMEDFSRWLTRRFGQRFEANRAARAEHEKEEGSHAG